MVFFPSPALHRIRQLVRLIRRHPDLPAKSWNSARRAPQLSNTELPKLRLPDPELPELRLPDPEQFVDSSASNNVVSGRVSLNTRQKRANCPRKPGGK
jgi:hypothetical protein